MTPETEQTGGLPNPVADVTAVNARLRAGTAPSRMMRLRTWLRSYAQYRQMGKGQRGMALMMVLVTLVILTTSVTTFNENSIVKMALAINARDELVAYYNARSGLNLTLLSLEFQYELESTSELIGRAVTQSNFQLWQYLKLMLPTFVSARLDSPVGTLDLTETGATGFGNLLGDIVFYDPIPEEGKINLNGFSGSSLEQDALIELCSLFSPEHFDPMFESMPHPNVQTRGELIGSIIDYIDADSNMLIVDENCNLIPSGAGAEERRYEDVNWQSKNEPLTTLDEMMLIAGMTPEILEAFRANLTVYAVAHEFFVNLADAQGHMGFLCAHVLGAQEGFNVCQNPMVGGQIAFLALALEGWSAFMSNPYMLLDHYLGLSGGEAQTRVLEGIAQGQMIAFRTEQDYFTVINRFLAYPEEALQYAVLSDPNRAALFGFAMGLGGEGVVAPRFSLTFDEAAIAQRVSVDMPRVFTVSATGTYGSAERTITAVADFSQGGKLLYWREF